MKPAIVQARESLQKVLGKAFQEKEVEIEEILSQLVCETMREEISHNRKMIYNLERISREG